MIEIDRDTSLLELAAAVAEALRERGIDVVLSGGAAVSIHTHNAYESFDIDFVVKGISRSVAAAMRSLDFEREGRHWVHPRARYIVEFRPGPVAVGDEIVRDFDEIRTEAGRLTILPPTECVMDRLAWLIHDGDLQCLDQAVEVASRHPVDLARIERWAARESPAGEARFAEFVEQLGRR